MWGFVKSIFKENDLECRDNMFLGDKMEEATDFGWVNAKPSHFVMLCEMERDPILV